MADDPFDRLQHRLTAKVDATHIVAIAAGEATNTRVWRVEDARWVAVAQFALYRQPGESFHFLVCDLEAGEELRLETDGTPITFYATPIEELPVADESSMPWDGPGHLCARVAQDGSPPPVG